jgi:copper(I)-binding protein
MFITGIALVLAAGIADAQVAVTDVWIRGTVAGQRATGAFMQLVSPVDVALVAVATPTAKTAEIHSSALEGGVMKMSAIDSLALPAGKTVELRPGGYHVMLLDLVQPLREGDNVPMTLTFTDASGRKTTQEVNATVRALTTGSATKP